MEPALMRGLPLWGSMVSVGPPLSARGPRSRSVPNTRLFPLPAAMVKPSALPMALELTCVIVWPVAKMSGAEMLEFPETMELAMVMFPAGPAVRAMPPPLTAALLSLMVLFCTTIEPVPTATPPPELAALLPELGLLDLGENRPQELWRKAAALSKNVRWHLIGHLQSNKCRDAVELFEMIESVDSLPLAQEISKWADKQAKTMPVLLEINVAGEATKFGFQHQRATVIEINSAAACAGSVAGDGAVADGEEARVIKGDCAAAGARAVFREDHIIERDKRIEASDVQATARAAAIAAREGDTADVQEAGA